MQLNLKIFKGITAVLAIGALGICLSCGSDPEPRVNVNINVDKNAPDAADGFNLEQFHRLLLEEKPESGQWDAQFLADLVNREDINNLDLDQNGEVDVIRIEPFGGGDSAGFQLYTKVKSEEPGAEDQEQTIATVVVERESDGNAGLSVSGNEQVYGSGAHYHHGGMGMGSYFFLAYMMSPRFGGYGGRGYGGYGGRRTVSTTAHNKNMQTRNAASTNKAPSATKSATASSAVKNSGAKTRTASNVKAGLRQPTSTQRKFQTQQKAKAASGFAKKKTGTNKSKSTGRTSTSRSRGGK